jgi:hypothetical protein
VVHALFKGGNTSKFNNYGGIMVRRILTKLFAMILEKNGTTLTLGSRSRQGFARTRAKRGARECGRVKMNTHTPRWTPIFGDGVSVDSRNFRERLQRWKPLSLKSFLYHWKAIEFYMSKWVRMTHLDICNTSYGQKKGWESNWEFDSQPRKVVITQSPCMEV